MNGEHRTDRPLIQHRLGVAVRFIDMFTRRPIDTVLDVRADVLPPAPPPPPPPARPPRQPNLPWRAHRKSDDLTYRFFVSDGETLPAGTVAVTVVDESQRYENFEPFNVLLPRPLTAHPPTPARSDFLIERELWPTRRATLAAGETAVVGYLASAALNPVARIRVRLGLTNPPAAAPYTYTNDRGDFLFRFPGLRSRMVGATFVATESLSIELHQPPNYTIAVVPTAPVFPAVITLGEVLVMNIQIP